MPYIRPARREAGAILPAPPDGEPGVRDGLTSGRSCHGERSRHPLSPLPGDASRQRRGRRCPPAFRGAVRRRRRLADHHRRPGDPARLQQMAEALVPIAQVQGRRRPRPQRHPRRRPRQGRRGARRQRPRRPQGGGCRVPSQTHRRRRRPRQPPRRHARRRGAAGLHVLRPPRRRHRPRHLPQGVRPRRVVVVGRGYPGDRHGRQRPCLGRGSGRRRHRVRRPVARGVGRSARAGRRRRRGLPIGWPPRGRRSHEPPRRRRSSSPPRLPRAPPTRRTRRWC